MAKNVTKGISSDDHTAARRASKARRRTGKTRREPIVPLFDAIRADRQEARASCESNATPRRPRRQAPRNRNEFVALFAQHVIKAADDRNWSNTVRAMVRDYIKSLTDEDGTGQAPDELRGAPLKIVRQKFAMSVLLSKPKDVDLPGMSQDWFGTALDSAYRYRQSLRHTPEPRHQPDPDCNNEPTGYAEFVFGTVPTYDYVELQRDRADEADFVDAHLR